MTIVGWIIFGVIAVVSFLFFRYVASGAFEDNRKRTGVLYIIIGVAFVFILFVGMMFYYSSTESGKRAYKSQKSELTGGLEREVKVYTMNGDLIEVFTGKFDMEYDEKRLMFDDENGKRHTIYYSTGTVIVNELGE